MRPSACLSVRPSVRPSVCLSVFIYSFPSFPLMRTRATFLLSPEPLNVYVTGFDRNITQAAVQLKMSKVCPRCIVHTGKATARYWPAWRLQPHWIARGKQLTKCRRTVAGQGNMVSVSVTAQAETTGLPLLSSGMAGRKSLFGVYDGASIGCDEFLWEIGIYWAVLGTGKDCVG